MQKRLHPDSGKMALQYCLQMELSLIRTKIGRNLLRVAAPIRLNAMKETIT
ncbi:MAG: hypothetical protein SCH66_10170 [Methanolobus sp.]|nr:hypothetical protein [Methanolobus sp.]